MEESAIEFSNLREYTFRPGKGTKRLCSLREALNNKATTIEDIVRWHWQIAEYCHYINHKHKNQQHLYPIKVERVQIDMNWNIIGTSIFRNSQGERDVGHILRTATSMLECSKIMVEYINIAKRNVLERKKIYMFMIISSMILNNNDVNRGTDCISEALYTVGKLIQLIENNLIDKLMQVLL